MAYQVTEFVDDYVINHTIRRNQDLPIELQLALGGTAAPAGLEGTDSNSGRLYTDQRREAIHLFG